MVDLSRLNADQLSLQRWLASSAGDYETVRAVNAELRARREAQQGGPYDSGPRVQGSNDDD